MMNRFFDAKKGYSNSFGSVAGTNWHYEKRERSYREREGYLFEELPVKVGFPISQIKYQLNYIIEEKRATSFDQPGNVLALGLSYKTKTSDELSITLELHHKKTQCCRGTKENASDPQTLALSLALFLDEVRIKGALRDAILDESSVLARRANALQTLAEQFDANSVWNPHSSNL